MTSFSFSFADWPEYFPHTRNIFWKFQDTRIQRSRGNGWTCVRMRYSKSRHVNRLRSNEQYTLLFTVFALSD